MFVILFVCLSTTSLCVCLQSVGGSPLLHKGASWAGAAAAAAGQRPTIICFTNTQPAAARGRKAALSYPLRPASTFFHGFTVCGTLSCLSLARLLSTVFACEVGGRGNTFVGAARGRKAALSESLPVLLAHRGPVVETSNQPTDRHKKLESISHYLEENLKLIDGSITHAS